MSGGTKHRCPVFSLHREAHEEAIRGVTEELHSIDRARYLPEAYHGDGRPPRLSTLKIPVARRPLRGVLMIAPWSFP